MQAFGMLKSIKIVNGIINCSFSSKQRFFFNRFWLYVSSCVYLYFKLSLLKFVSNKAEMMCLGFHMQHLSSETLQIRIDGITFVCSHSLSKSNYLLAIVHHNATRIWAGFYVLVSSASCSKHAIACNRKGILSRCVLNNAFYMLSTKSSL